MVKPAIAFFDLEMLVPLLLWLLFVIAPCLVSMGVIYQLVTWPFRFLERARFLIEIVAAALKDGRSAEQTLIHLARRHERAFGPRLHLLTAHLERGLTLGEGLLKTPKLMPPHVAAMIRLGEEIGDLPGMLPPARRVLQDGLSQTRHAQYGVIALVSCTLMMSAFIVWMLSTWVFPKFDVILLDMDEGRGLVGGMLFQSLGAHSTLWIAGVLLLTGVSWIWCLLCLGGIERMFWTQSKSPGLAAHLWNWLPWRSKRLKRDFAHLLSLLLDAGVAEPRAVAMAAAATVDPGIKARARRVIEDLSSGLWLPSAIRHMDDDGQFAFRLRHATLNPEGFASALAGWEESLEAMATQEETVAIGATDTALHLLGGAAVCVITVSIFQFITTLTEVTAPW